jgi:thiol-disulfide isomerase/thioredoxin
MKKLFSIVVTVVIASIGFAQKTITFQADIANRNGDVIYIKTPTNKIFKEIKVNEKGVFEGSFDAEDGSYMMFDGVEYAQLFLKGGYNLKLKMDAKEFDESIVFKGKGADENNFLAQASLLDEKFNYDETLTLNEEDFAKTIAAKQKSDIERLEKAKLDSKFVEMQKKSIEEGALGIKQYYNQTKANKKLNNAAAPAFDYENFAGGKTKLADLKGKYVYIDVWATWCGPCRAEIPFLKKAEEQFHGKNIEFVSISVDVAKDHEKWKTFVKDKQLGGTQLFADNNWNSDFIKAFSINSIPRFILIDPNGNVIDADSARPSSPQLIEKLEKLLN